MPDKEYPSSTSRKSLRIQGKVRQDEEALVSESQLSLDEAGLFKQEKSSLIACWSCSSAIKSEEGIGGNCYRCEGVLDNACAELYRCKECRQLSCYDDSIHVGSSHFCQRDGWLTLIKPFALGLAISLLILVVAPVCGAFS